MIPPLGLQVGTSLSRTISVQQHNDFSSPVTPGGVDIEDIELVFSNGGAGQLVVERGDGIGWNTVAGGGWVIGAAAVFIDGSGNPINLGNITSFAAGSVDFTPGARLIIASPAVGIVAQTITCDVFPVWNTSVFEGDPGDWPPFLRKGALVIDVGNGATGGTGVRVVDAYGWSPAGGAQDPARLRLIHCAYPGEGGGPFFSMVGNSMADLRWKVLAFQGGAPTAVGRYSTSFVDGDRTLVANEIHFSNKTTGRQIFTIPDDDTLPDGTWFEVWGRSASDGWRVTQPNNNTVTLVAWMNASYSPAQGGTSAGNAGQVNSTDPMDAIRIVKYGARMWQAVMLRGIPTVV